MTTIYTLEQIFPALKNVRNEEVAVISNGMEMVTVDADKTPLMELEYALNGPALQVVRKYVAIS